jgi:signal transduction histidine kinase
MRGGPGFRRGGRRFRRAALVVLALVILLVSALATVVTSAVTGHAPSHRITLPLAALVVIGLILSARWLWRSTRTIAALIDTADRVAGGDYLGRVDAGSGQLGSLAAAFNEMTDRLRTDDERRRELLADVAHELRTPLQVIRGSVEGMLDGLYPADAERLRPLLEQTIVMARLLDDLRTLSMAEAGVLELHREPVDPRAVAEDVVRAYRSAAEEAGVTLEATIAPDAPALLEADPLRLAEILANLVANALRHTPKGGRVGVQVDGGDRSTSFEVTDTGSGIPEDQLPYVFDRFVTAADTGGTGLGLSIAKRLVEAHGGTIKAASVPEGGTTIRFWLPES